MLKAITIKNLAVIDLVEVEFDKGFNVLTGETGAGKSIVIDAISALIGNRVASDIVRTGESHAVVEAVVMAPDSVEFGKAIEAAEVHLAGKEFTLRREIGANGRTRAFIDDQSVSIKFLRDIASFIVEIHMQGEQQSLSNARTQLHLLDEYAGCAPVRREVESLYGESRKVARELAKLQDRLLETERTRDYLNYQLGEIEAVNPIIGEDEELENERTLLQNSERISQLKTSVHEILYGEDESVLSRLKNVKKHLQELGFIDRRIDIHLDSLDNASMILTDIAESVRENGVDFDSTISRLNNIEERLSQLERLKRRYGSSLNEVLAFKVSIQNKIMELDGGEDLRTTLIRTLHDLNSRYISVAAELSIVRRKAAAEFSLSVTEKLYDVALPDASFRIGIVTVDFDKAYSDDDLRALFDAVTLGSHGGDSVEFFFTANPGEELKSLAQIASGGELSRLMLIIKEVARSGMSRETFGEIPLIFDEIDAGISGRVAETVGRKLALLAQSQQVLCVTHQAQIARFADCHFKVEKKVESGRTKSTVKKLDVRGRVNEIASLIAANESEPSVQETAKWLVESARTKNYRTTGKKSVRTKIQES